jgi:hypothetical protein
MCALVLTSYGLTSADGAYGATVTSAYGDEVRCRVTRYGDEVR